MVDTVFEDQPYDFSNWRVARIDPIEAMKRLDKYLGIKKKAKPIQQRGFKKKEINTENKPGYVYLMRSENGLYKIGRAKNIKKRLDGLNRDIPVKVEVLHYIYCQDYARCERIIHHYLGSFRVKYEWFELNLEQIAWFKKLTDYQIIAIKERTWLESRSV